MTRLFLGGKPTGPDVKRLRDAFPDVSEGQEFTYAEIEKVISVAAGDNRFRTVTSAWRKEMLNEADREIVAIPTIGFRCLTAAERLTTNIKSFRQGTKKQGRSVRRIGMVKAEDLSEHDQAKQLHMVRLGTQLLQSAGSMLKQLDAPKSQEQLSLLRKPTDPTPPAQS